MHLVGVTFIYWIGHILLGDCLLKTPETLRNNWLTIKSLIVASSWSLIYLLIKGARSLEYKVWLIQLAFLRFEVWKLFHSSLTVCNTSLFLTRLVKLILCVLFQHGVSELLRCFQSTSRKLITYNYKYGNYAEHRRYICQTWRLFDHAPCPGAPSQNPLRVLNTFIRCRYSSFQINFRFDMDPAHKLRRLKWPQRKICRP